MKFLAVDISSVFRRYWEAAHADAFGTARTRTVSKVLEAAEGYDRIAVVRDPPITLPNKTPCAPFRRAVFAGYKADRPDPGEGYREQIAATVEELKGRGATSWVSPKMGEHGGVVLFGEADDVIASLAFWYQEKRGEDWHLRILTGDTDLWALVDDSISIDVLTLENQVITAQTVQERYGVDPHLVPEVKALCGDDSDRYWPFKNPEKNAKGHAKPGIGAETAAKIVLSDVGRAEGDRSGADAVLRAVLAGEDPGIGLNAPVVFCLKHHGAAALSLGRQMAYMRPFLIVNDEGSFTLDFSPILEEPKRRVDKPQAPPISPEVQPAEPQRPAPSTAMTVAQSTAMAQPDPHGLEPVNMGDAWQLAQWMWDSNLFRASLSSPAACLMVIGIARSMRLPVFLAAQHASVIRGKLNWSARFQMALVQTHESTKRFHFDPARCNDRQAVIVFERTGPAAAKGEYSFTIDDARKAGFLDGKHSEQWTKRQPVMLRWACVRECAAAYWGDILWGMHATDEVDSDPGDPADRRPVLTAEEA